MWRRRSERNIRISGSDRESGHRRFDTSKDDDGSLGRIFRIRMERIIEGVQNSLFNGRRKLYFEVWFGSCWQSLDLKREKDRKTENEASPPLKNTVVAIDLPSTRQSPWNFVHRTRIPDGEGPP
jgi:hypothetical protein